MILVWLLAGVAVGLVNALTMVITVRHLSPTAPARGVHWTVAGMFARWVLTAAALMVAFRRGFEAGLLVLTGFWIARWGAILWWNRATGQKKG
jgi:hypothetical protein